VRRNCHQNQQKLLLWRIEQLRQAIEYRQKAITRIFDESPVVLRDSRLDEFTPLTFYTSVCPLFVVPHKAAVTRDVSREDCGQAARQFFRLGRGAFYFAKPTSGVAVDHQRGLGWPSAPDSGELKAGL
jgi:hypothetical protein